MGNRGPFRLVILPTLADLTLLGLSPSDFPGYPIAAAANAPVAVRLSDGAAFQTLDQQDYDSGAGTANRVGVGLVFPAAGGPQQVDATHGLPVKVIEQVPGTAATDLGKARAAAPGATDTGVLLLGVRADTPAALDATGKYSAFTLDPQSGLWVSLATLLSGEDQTNSLLAVAQKPVVGAVYGSSIYDSTLAAAAVVATIKATAGNLVKVNAVNRNAAARWVGFYNKVTPVATNVPLVNFWVAGNSVKEYEFRHPAYFDTALAVVWSVAAGVYTAGATAAEHEVQAEYI